MSRHGEEGDELWAAVADPTRRRLLDVLLAHGEATATTLAGELPVTRQAVAKHLAVLDRAGLVEGHRRGREMRFTVHPGAPRRRQAAGWRASPREWDGPSGGDQATRRVPRTPLTWGQEGVRSESWTVVRGTERRAPRGR